MSKVKAELERMENLGVISKVDIPNDWWSGMVVVPKPDGKIRKCLDLKTTQWKRVKRNLSNTQDWKYAGSNERIQVLPQIGLQFGILTTEIRPRLWFANHIYHTLWKILF